MPTPEENYLSRIPEHLRPTEYNDPEEPEKPSRPADVVDAEYQPVEAFGVEDDDESDELYEVTADDDADDE